MKKHHILYIVGGYLAVAYVYNNYVASPTGTKLPLDLLSQII